MPLRRVLHITVLCTSGTDPDGAELTDEVRAARDSVDTTARFLCRLVGGHIPTEPSASPAVSAAHFHSICIAKMVRDDQLSILEAESAQGIAGVKQGIAAALMIEPEETRKSIVSLSDTISAKKGTPGSSRGSRSPSNASPRNATGPRLGGVSPRPNSRESVTTTKPSMAATREESKQIRDVYLNIYLPNCELVKASSEGVFNSIGSTVSAPPLVFLYHLRNQTEVIAALDASPMYEKPRGKKEESAASEAADKHSKSTGVSTPIEVARLIQSEIWATIDPLVKQYEAQKGCLSGVDDDGDFLCHIPVVWVVTDPRLLQAFRCTEIDTNETAPAAICMILRAVVYLYDPAQRDINTVVRLQESLDQLQSGSHPRDGDESVASSPSRRIGSPSGGGSTKKFSPAGGASSQRGEGRGSNAVGGREHGGRRTSNPLQGTHRGGPNAVSLSRSVSDGAVSSLARALPPVATAAPAELEAFLYDVEEVEEPVTSKGPAPPSGPRGVALFLRKQLLYRTAVVMAGDLKLQQKLESQKGLSATSAKAILACEELRLMSTLLDTAVVPRPLSPYNARSPSASTLPPAVGGHLSRIPWPSSWTWHSLQTIGPTTSEGLRQENVDAAVVAYLTGAGPAGSGSETPHPLWKYHGLPLVLPPTVSPSWVQGLLENADISASAPVASISGPGNPAVTSKVEGDDARLALWCSAICNSNASAFLCHYAILIHAYNAWYLSGSEQWKRRVAAGAVSAPCGNGPHDSVAAAGRMLSMADLHRFRYGAVHADGVEQTSYARERRAGGAFTALNAAAALVAEVDRQVALAKPLKLLHVAHPLVPLSDTLQASSASHAVIAKKAVPSRLFARYASSFQSPAEETTPSCTSPMSTAVMVAPTHGDTKGTASLLPPSPCHPTKPPQNGAAISVAVASPIGTSDDVLPVPYEREVEWLMQQYIAKNIGCFAVNVSRGTDTIAAPLPTNELTVTGTALQKTQGLLVQSSSMKGSRRRQVANVSAMLKQYVHAARYIKEVEGEHLARRTMTEASVTLEQRLAATISPQNCSGPADQHRDSLETPVVVPITQRSDAENDDAPQLQRMNAMELLHRYVERVVKGGRQNAVLDTAKEESIRRSIEQTLTPREREHLCHEAMITEVLAEAGLFQQHSAGVVATAAGEAVTLTMKEPSLLSPGRTGVQPQDAVSSGQQVGVGWSVTQQVPVEGVTQALLRFRERYGAEAVTLRALALDYSFPLEDGDGESAAVTANGEMLDSGHLSEHTDSTVLRTSAYAHNAVNVHPTRRATQLWVAGIAVPESRRRTLLWTVPRGGLRTSVESYALLRYWLASGVEVEGGLTWGEVPVSVYRALLMRFIDAHLENSISLVPLNAPTLPGSPMLRERCEVLYPHSDAIVEVWRREDNCTCRYVKADELVAALHSTIPCDGAPCRSASLYLVVHFDDGLHLTCTSALPRTQKSSLAEMVTAKFKGGEKTPARLPKIDVHLTTSNFILQRRQDQAVLQLYYFGTNTTPKAAASSMGACTSGSSGPRSHLAQTCAALLQQTTTIRCVHLDKGAASILLTTVEEEVARNIEEATGVVQRIFASGIQLWLYPSGSTVVRFPISDAAASTAAGTTKSKVVAWCETLTTPRGMCYVRTIATGGGAAARNTRQKPFLPNSSQKEMRRGAGGGSSVAFVSRSNGDLVGESAIPAIPAFVIIETEVFPLNSQTTVDTLHYCRMRVREDGLSITEYLIRPTQQCNSAAAAATAVSRKPAVRVVVQGDGTSITTILDHEAVYTAAVAAAECSPLLKKLLAEVLAIQQGLYPDATPSRQRVRWCVEGPRMPRFFLFNATSLSGAATASSPGPCATSFYIIFGDNTVLQRRWMAAPYRNGSRATPGGAAQKGIPISEATSGPVSEVPETVLARPTNTTIRVVHDSAVVVVEPASVMSATQALSKAAFAVGEGLPFFDMGCGGGLRLVDRHGCVTEVSELGGSGQTTSGPRVAQSSPCSYGDLLRSLVSPHYSPHRLPYATQLQNEVQWQQEREAYATLRERGVCPPLQRRLRDLVEHYIIGEHLLRTDVLQPTEAARLRYLRAVHAVKNPAPPLTAGSDGSSLVGSTSTRTTATSFNMERADAAIQPICYAQLANGEAVRFVSQATLEAELQQYEQTHADTCDVVSLPGASSASPLLRVSETAVVGEPGVTQFVVSQSASTAQLHYTMEGSTEGPMTLWQRVHAATRLSVFCCGALSQSRNGTGYSTSETGFPSAMKSQLQAPSVQRVADSLVSTLATTATAVPSSLVVSVTPPSAAVLLNGGSRWLPPALQPPQQYLSTGEDGTAGGELWRNEPPTYETLAIYLLYKPTSTMTKRIVVDGVLRQAGLLVNLSHFHKAMTREWQRDTPKSATDEQQRLRAIYQEMMSSHGRPTRPALVL